MVVAFVTMLLGLTAGVQTIEVAVSETTAKVEILLDGASAGMLTTEPWALEVDLGVELEPHRLLAIARDATGRELGRAEQWINLPHPAVEARLLLDNAGAKSPRFARLIWSAAGQGAPEHVAVSFDGEPLTVENPERIALPEYDPQALHFLRAELRFASTLEAVAEAAFGGIFGERVATDIQALALRVDPRVTFAPLRGDGHLPDPTGLDGWFNKSGQPLAVRAVDAGPADVVMVVDLAAGTSLQELKASNVVHRPAPRPRGERADPNLPGYTPQSARRPRGGRSRATARVPIPAGLHPRDRLRFVYPIANLGPAADHPYRIFPVSEPFTLEDGGIFDILTRVNLPADRGDAQRLADAVAVAGIQTYASHRRRIVVLVVGEEPVDTSRFRLPAVRRYLQRLRVPLAVWRVREPASDVYKPGRGARPGNDAAPRLSAAELGPVLEISSVKQLKAAVNSLRRNLDGQRIVWVEGHHLPQDVELAATATGVHWAGKGN